LYNGLYPFGIDVDSIISEQEGNAIVNCPVDNKLYVPDLNPRLTQAEIDI